MKLHLLETRVEIDIPFHDLDPMNIVWHGNYARYFEVARCALLERMTYNYDQMAASGYGFPVVDLQVRYIQALRFKQKIAVFAWISEYEHRLKVNYRIEDAHTGQRLTRGHTVQVAVDLSTLELCWVSPAPLLERLRGYV